MAVEIKLIYRINIHNLGINGVNAMQVVKIAVATCIAPMVSSSPERQVVHLQDGAAVRSVCWRWSASAMAKQNRLIK